MVLLVKGVSEINGNEVNKQKGAFLNMLLGMLGASLLSNLLTDEGVKERKQKREANKHVGRAVRSI